jgi:hypothetical protein
MTGRLAVLGHRQRVDAAFQRARGLNADAELLADFAKYLCILVAGFVEKSLAEIVLEHARFCGAPSLQKFVEQNTKKFTNANSERLLQFLGSFDSEWRGNMEGFLTDERKDAVNSVYALRNNIAHGVSVDLTLARIQDYYYAIKDVVAFAQDLCIPEANG